MKNIKQIREAYDASTREEDNKNRRFTSLVRAGLYDAKKLPALKRAFEKGPDHMTAIEKRMLLNLLDSLMAQVVSNQPIYQKVRTNVANMSESTEASDGQGYLAKYDPRGEKGQPKAETIPAVLILKRKAIRVYPDNQKVALYYAQAIDKYISVPFGTFGDGGMGGVNESVVLKKPKLVKRPSKKTKVKPTTSRPVTDRKKDDDDKPSFRKNFSSAAGAGHGIVTSTVAGAIATVRDRQIAKRKAQQANEAVLPAIKKMISDNITERTIAFGKEEITINNTVAKKIMSVHESMNRQNRKTMENALNESLDSFNKVVTFVTRY